MELYMKKRKKLALPILASLIMAFFALPATASEAKELTMPTKENPYFSLAHQNGGKPVRFKYHAKLLFQGDSCVVNLQNVKDSMSVVFRSSDSSVLTVKKLSDSSCRVTGMGYGNARVIAHVTKSNGFFLFDETETIDTKFKISPKAASIRFRSKQKKITVQSTAKLAMTIRPSISKETPVFKTQNSKIATVSRKGIVTGRKAGKTYIIATIQNGKSAKCKIIVKKPKKISGKKKPKKAVGNKKTK